MSASLSEECVAIRARGAIKKALRGFSVSPASAQQLLGIAGMGCLPPVVAVALVQAAERDIQISGSQRLVDCLAMLTALLLHIQPSAEAWYATTAFVAVVLAHRLPHMVFVAAGVSPVIDPARDTAVVGDVSLAVDHADALVVLPVTGGFSLAQCS